MLTTSSPFCITAIKTSPAEREREREKALRKWPCAKKISGPGDNVVSRYRAAVRGSASAHRFSAVSLLLFGPVDQSSSRLPSVTGPQQFATYSSFRSLGYNLLSLTSVTSHSIPPYPEPHLGFRLSLYHYFASSPGEDVRRGRRIVAPRYNASFIAERRDAPPLHGEVAG